MKELMETCEKGKLLLGGSVLSPTLTRVLSWHMPPVCFSIITKQHASLATEGPWSWKTQPPGPHLK